MGLFRGDNIALSLVIKPASLAVFQQFQLSACVAVAVHDFFAKYAGEDTRINGPMIYTGKTERQVVY
ncbi:MAG: hypothetical protein WDO16_11635 [Bacteroidota bacterium]